MISTISSLDQRLLEGLAKADNASIQQVYDLALPSIILWVKENKGSEADARDIFQDALMALFRQLETRELKLTCTLKSYLRIMCRNLWFSRLRKTQRIQLSPMEEEAGIVLDQDIIAKLEQTEKEKLFFKHFDLLDDNCKKILRAFFDKVPLKAIAVQLETSENYIKKRKFLCKEKLVRTIQADHLFKEM
ncbi:MAG: RNA polymerase sigma factor [Saprospiraceae bacterium]